MQSINIRKDGRETMSIHDLSYFTLIDSKVGIQGGNTPAFSWSDWLENFSNLEGNSASASFSAIATGDNTYTDVQATLIVTENSSYASVSSVAIASSSS
jgi:hypothetical protein